jgi:hypothetical protein
MGEQPRRATISFAEASSTRMTFGKHSGKTIDSIAVDDDGLRYLDWLRGEMANESQTGHKAHIFDALQAYLSDPSIAKEVENLPKQRWGN